MGSRSNGTKEREQSYVFFHSFSAFMQELFRILLTKEKCTANTSSQSFSPLFPCPASVGHHWRRPFQISLPKKTSVSLARGQEQRILGAHALLVLWTPAKWKLLQLLGDDCRLWTPEIRREVSPHPGGLGRQGHSHKKKRFFNFSCATYNFMTLSKFLIFIILSFHLTGLLWGLTGIIIECI